MPESNKKKAKLILKLGKIFKKNQWIYGIRKRKNKNTTHSAFFEFTVNKQKYQIGWNFNAEKEELFPEYNATWKRSKTVRKLRKMTEFMLKNPPELKIEDIDLYKIFEIVG